MTGDDDAFLEMLRSTFRGEAADHLQTITAGLIELERQPEAAAQRGLVETVFRAAHSLKGAARAVDWGTIERDCERLEDTFADWKRTPGAAAHAEMDALYQTLDAIAALLPPDAAAMPVRDEQASRGTIAPPAVPFARAASATPVVPPPQAAPVPAGARLAPASVRIPVEQLHERLMRAEEMLALKLTSRQRAIELDALRSRLDACCRAWAAAEASQPLLRQRLALAIEAAGAEDRRALAALVEPFERHGVDLRALQYQTGLLARAATRDSQTVGHAVDELLEDTRQLQRLPFSWVSAALPKLVRDLCREQGKEAELVIRGDELSLDRQVLEEIRDPLIHLLRNAVDHGVEMPEARRRAGKPARATVSVVLSQGEGQPVELLVADDGAGIDAPGVRAAAAAQGRAGASEPLGDAEALALVFESEVSTRPVAGSISGRGLGLAIVREKVEKLGGSISVDSRAGEGTRFCLRLPALLATFRGVLVEAAGRRFVLPTLHVALAMRVAADEIRTVEGRETITVGGRTVAHVRLAEVLGLPPGAPARRADARAPVVVLGSGERCIAFAVDALEGEQEVLVKRFSRPLVRLRHVLAATVLGSGEVVPILRIDELLDSARSAGAVPQRQPEAPAAVLAAQRILVVEDSITARMLIRSILEAAGYVVETAVDGIDAFTRLRSEDFDLVVSDIEMPRLDGFDLTTRIRAEARLAELPVVLLTALETREDRERGVDAGASAYLLKSGFDQSHLLETVRRLLA